MNIISRVKYMFWTAVDNGMFNLQIRKIIRTLSNDKVTVFRATDFEDLSSLDRDGIRHIDSVIVANANKSCALVCTSYNVEDVPHLATVYGNIVQMAKSYGRRSKFTCVEIKLRNGKYFTANLASN